MIVNCYQINESLQLVPLHAEEAEGAGEDAGTMVWLDLTDPTPAQLEAWLDRIGVTDLARLLCVEARDRPGFYPRM